MLTYELDIESRDGSDGWSLDWIMMREEITSIRQNGDDGRSSQGTILTRFYSSDKGTMIHDDIEDSQVNNILLTTSNCGPADKGAAAAGFLTKWKAGELENLEPYAGHNAKQVPTPPLSPYTTAASARSGPGHLPGQRTRYRTRYGTIENFGWCGLRAIPDGWKMAESCKHNGFKKKALCWADECKDEGNPQTGYTSGCKFHLA